MEFKTHFEAGANYGMPYVHQKADFIQLAKLKTSALEDIAWKCITHLSQSDIIEKTTKITDLATVAVIATDKMLLLRAKTPTITYAALEDYRWAEEQLQGLMREFNKGRVEMLDLLKEKAPTLAGMLIVGSE